MGSSLYWTRVRLGVFAAMSAAVIVLSACGGGADDAGGIAGNTGATSGGGSGASAGSQGECPFATTAEVSRIMAREMDLTLSSRTDCEWLQQGNTAVSASVSTVDPDIGEKFNDRNGRPVAGIGDEAYEDKNGLYLRVGTKQLEVFVTDLNANTGLDEAAAMRELAKVVARKA